MRSSFFFQKVAPFQHPMVNLARCLTSPTFFRTSRMLFIHAATSFSLFAFFLG